MAGNILIFKYWSGHELWPDDGVYRPFTIQASVFVDFMVKRLRENLKFFSSWRGRLDIEEGS